MGSIAQASTGCSGVGAHARTETSRLAVGHLRRTCSADGHFCVESRIKDDCCLWCFL